MNEEKSYSSFYVNVSLMKSPGCDDKFICTLYSSTNFECINVSTSMFPDECTGNNNDKKKFIIIVTVASCIIIIIVVIIIVVFLMYKKKNEVKNIQSMVDDKKLLSEEEKLNRSYIY